MAKGDLGILLLHALPLDGAMWKNQMHLFPDATYAPNLYDFGDRLEDWAGEVLQLATERQLIVVGCSVGGSCALEIAQADPERVAALVLIGTKASHNPDPDLHTSTITRLRTDGVDAAWREIWAPHFWNAQDEQAFATVRDIAKRQSIENLLKGLNAFHTRSCCEQLVTASDIPIHVVTGEHDILPGRQQCAELAKLAPQGQMHVISSCGHYVPLEQPEQFNSVLNDVVTTQIQKTHR